MADAGGTVAGASLPPSPAVWDPDALRRFYKAFHELGVSNWVQIAAAVGPPVSAEQCEALYRQNTSFLSLPQQPGLEAAFVAMVNDRFNTCQEAAAVPPVPAAAVGGTVGSGGGGGGSAAAAVPPAATTVAAAAGDCGSGVETPPRSRGVAGAGAGGEASVKAEGSDRAQDALAAVDVAAEMLAAEEAGVDGDDEGCMDLENLVMQKGKRTPRGGRPKPGTPTDATRLAGLGGAVLFAMGGRPVTPRDRKITSPVTPRSTGRPKSASALRLAAAAFAAGETSTARKRRTQARKLFDDNEELGEGDIGAGLDSLPLDKWRDRHDFGDGVDALLSLADVAQAAADREAGRTGADMEEDHPVNLSGTLPDGVFYEGPQFKSEYEEHTGGEEDSGVGMDGAGWNRQQDDSGGERDDGGTTMYGSGEIDASLGVSTSGRVRRKSARAAAADEALPYYDGYEVVGLAGTAGGILVGSPVVTSRGRVVKTRGGGGTVGGVSLRGGGRGGRQSFMASASAVPERREDSESEHWSADVGDGRMSQERSPGKAPGGRKSTRRSQPAQHYSDSEYMDVPLSVPPIRVSQHTSSGGSGDTSRGGTMLGKRMSGEVGGRDLSKRQAVDDDMEGRPPPYPRGGGRYASGGARGSSKQHLPVRMRHRKPVMDRAPATATPTLRALFTRAASASYTAGGTPAGSGQQASGDDGAAGATGGSGAAAAASAPVGETGEVMSPSEVALRHCLNGRMRRWVQAEWLYSAIDRPFYLKSEMQEFLSRHLGLAPGTRLTRAEWSLVRGAFGRPRRLSLLFLKEERIRLEGFRQHVRRRYEEIGPSVNMPDDLPRPLRVGQEVVARHPSTRQIHEGHILTIKGNHYRVQFTRSELMSEHIRDVDVMPVDPTENLPAAMMPPPAINGRPVPGPNGMAHLMRRKTNVVAHVPLRGPAAGRLQQEAGRQFPLMSPGGAVVPLGASPVAVAGAYPAVAALQQQYNNLDMQRDSDRDLLAEANARLEAKEALVKQLKDLNHEAGQGVHRDTSGRHSEQFQQVYSSVVLQLKEANTQLDATLHKLSARQAQVQHAVAVTNATAVTAAAAAASSAATTLAANGLAGAPTAPGAPGTPTAAPPSAVKQEAGEVAASSGHLQAAAAAAPGLLQALPAEGAATALATELAGHVVNDATNHARVTVAKCRAEVRAAAAGAPAVAALQQAASSAEAADGQAAAPAVAGDVAALDVSQQQQLRAAAPVAPGGARRDEGWLNNIVTGCVGMLFTLQKCTQSPLPAGVMEASLDLALQRLQPQCSANQGTYAEITNSLRTLKAQLSRPVA